jgi:flagellar hook-associated protein 1
MAGPSALMSIGMRAMVTNYAALQTTGHNIANAGVEGYSRQQVEFGTSKGQFSGAGFFGRGVELQTVTRAHNDFLTREATGAKSLSSMDAARYESLQELESVFPIGESGVGYAMGQFLNSIVDVASRPGDVSARQVVLARATDTAARFNAASDQLDRIQSSLSERMTASVSAINGLAANIATVNQRIAEVHSQGHPPNDLLDERDRLISQLSEHVQITTIGADDGTTSVFIAGGQRLVLGIEAAKLQLVPDPEEPTRSAVAISEANFLRVLPHSTLGGGELAGLLRFQNDDMVDARTQLGQMAAAFGAAVNQQQSFGLDLGNPPGAGAPIFSTGTPQVQPNADNARDVSGDFVAQVNITVTDFSQLAAAEYALSADPVSGAWKLTRSSDGHVQTVNDGDTVDGFTINLGSPAPSSTDRFLLKPVSDASGRLQVVLTDPRGLAAALPVTATMAATNTGSASVASLQVVSNAIDPEQTASIAFSSDTGDYNWELRDRTTNALMSSGSGTWQAGEAIELNGFEVTLAGVPRNGDSLEVSKTVYAASNNGNATAMLNLRDMARVGLTVQTDGSVGGGRSFSDAYASAMADMGVRVQGSRVASEVSDSVAARTELNRSAAAGVNLDEEAAKLLAFQQSYQASAKVLQAAQTIFDTLLSIVDR